MPHLVLLTLLPCSLPHPLQLQPGALENPFRNLCIGLHREQHLPMATAASAPAEQSEHAQEGEHLITSGPTEGERHLCFWDPRLQDTAGLGKPAVHAIDVLAVGGWSTAATIAQMILMI